ncbi:MAG: hypothetical protein HY007_00405 [Candidatus Sungbacteria bacterium]|nr:hypothetical protein [Candidatus Sungbacteria bacterium]
MKEGVLEDREGSLEQIGERAMERIENKVTKEFEGEPYHNPEHPKGVGAAAEEGLDIAEQSGITVTKEMRRAGRFAAAAHDMVIRKRVNMTPGTFGYGTTMRYRGFGEKMPPAVRDALKGEKDRHGNEEASWLELEQIMNEEDPDGAYFTENVRRMARAAIAATYPDVEFPAPFPSPDDAKIGRRNSAGEVEAVIDVTDMLSKTEDGRPAGLKFFQPFLTAESSLVTALVAIGDLSEGGRVDPREFRKKGNAEYWELRALLRQRIADGFADLSDKPKERVVEMANAAKDMLAWAQTQIGFLLWQKIRFAEILQTNPDMNEFFREKMRRIYSHFDANILDAYYRAGTLSGRFKQLMEPAAFTHNPHAETELRDLASMMDYDEFPLQK